MSDDKGALKSDLHVNGLHSERRRLCCHGSSAEKAIAEALATKTLIRGMRAALQQNIAGVPAELLTALCGSNCPANCEKSSQDWCELHGTFEPLASSANSEFPLTANHVVRKIRTNRQD